MRTLLFAGLLLSALPSVAHEGASGIVKERMDRFKETKEQMKELRGLLKAGDTAAAGALAGQIAEWARVLPEHFPEDSNPAPSEALDDIWLDWDGFMKVANDFQSAAETMAAQPSMANFKPLGGSCKACHDSYRE